MPSENPYDAPMCGYTDSRADMRSRSNAPGAMAGFLLGFLSALALGIHGLYQHNAYVASLAPGEYVCGLGSLAAISMIFIGSPFFGIIGAVSGWLVSVAFTNYQPIPQQPLNDDHQ